MEHWQYTEASNTCKIRGYEAHSLPTFRRHVKLCSSSEAGSTNATTSLPHSCSECLYKTPLKRNYDRHRACHGVNAAFKCDFCIYSSTGETAVRRHVSSHHSAEERETLEGSKEPSPKLGFKSKQQKKKSSKYVQQSPAESGSSDDLMKPVVESSENVVDEDEAANDEEAMIGEAVEIESQDIDLDGKLQGDIVWNCLWCKLDFKNRQEMDTHTKLEHSIELKDCVLSTLDKDTSSETLFELEQQQLPKLPTATLTLTADEKIHKCELCTYRGKRVRDLKQHFTRKHIQNSSEPNQKTCKRPSKEESPPANKSKKSKISKPAYDEGPAILAKLLPNDDPNSVYNPSNNGEESVGKGQKHLQATLDTLNKDEAQKRFA